MAVVATDMVDINHVKEMKDLSQKSDTELRMASHSR